MKARLTKLFTLLTILTLGITNVWAEDFTISKICTGSYLSPGNIVKVTLASNTSASSGRLDTKSSKTGGFTISSNAPGVYVKSFTFTDSQYSGNKKGTITCENGGTLVVDANGNYTITANANATSVEIKVVASSSGDCKITGLSVIATNGTANNIETLSGFSFSSGTFSFTSKVNGSSVTPTVGLTSQSSSSWSASSSNITAPSSNDSKTITVSAISGYHLKYVAFYDSNCRLSLVEKSSTGGTVNGASWTAADDKTTTVTFKNGISTSITITNVFVVTEADAPATTYTVTYQPGDGTGDDVVDSDAKTVKAFADCSFTAPTGYEFKEWQDGSSNVVAAGATVSADMTLTAIYRLIPTKYTVTYNLNGAPGDAPTETDKAEGDAFNLAAAPSWAGHAFDGWLCSADAAVKNAGSSYTMTATNTTFTAQWKAAPIVLYSLTVTNSSQVNLDNGGATHDLAVDATIVGGGAYMQNDHASSAQTILKSTSLRFKAGTVTLVMTLNTALKEGDTIKATGLNQSGICFGVTFNREENLANALGSDASYFIVPAEFEGETTLYAWRIAGSETTCSSIQIIRPVKYTVNFAAGTGASGTMAAKEYPAGAEVTLPACTFTAPTNKEFDAWVSDDVTITAGKFTMPANDVTITATWKAEATKYDITYYPGANGSGSIAAGKKTHDVAYVLSSERFTRAGYLQTGWATTDGGAQAYALGATYSANEALDLYPVWTELDTYVAPFECATSAPAGWTFSNDGFDADNKATAASVCTFVENGITTPKTTTGDGTSDDDVAFAKNTDAIATYDLGIATTVAALNVTLNGGSSSAFNETIEYIGADGTTVKKEYTNSLSAGNWKDNVINKTDIVEDVRYIRIHGASKWVVMKDFSVQYIETRTKYDVTFAAGTGASGSMDALHYIEGAEVVLPACTFTAPTDKEFDVWTSSDVTITDGKFTMPAKNVTVTATWKDAVTRFTVTFETNGGSSIDDQEVEINGHPAAVDDPTKDNYVFVGWYNNSDLADEHAVADITALTITEDITLYAKWALDLQVTKIVFSNGFDAFINGNTVTAYYMDGEAAPTIESYEANANVKTTDGVLIEGSKLVLVGTDDSRKEYNFTLDAVAPMTSFDKQTFDGSETYIKGGSGFAAERGWKFQKNADDGRIPKGLTRLYVFLGGGADKATFKSYAKRAVHVYVNNVLVSSVTELPSNAEFDIPLDPNDATNMIAFISNQTGGDAGIFDVKLNEHTVSSDATLGALTVNGDAVALVDGVFEYDVELAYGTSSAPTIVATANDAGAVATVVSCTLSGATIEVVPESGASDKKTYTLTFTVSRYPKIIIWDGATMSAVATSPDASGLEWAVTGFGSIANYSVSLDGKDYVKCLPSGGNGGAARNISLTIPDGYVGRVTIVFGSHSDDERGMFIGKTATKTLDETSILTLYSPGRTSLVKGTSLWSGGTYYINPMASVDFYEITVELTPGYARTDMLGAGVLGTICVDHNVAINEAFGASFYELAGKEATYGKIVFEEIIAGELEAGKPYVFQAEGNLIALLYGSTSVSAPVNTGALKGTFTGELFTAEQAAEKDIYFFRDHALWSAKETGLQVLANRAWLEMGDVNPITNPNPAPGRRRITLGVNGTNVATGLEDLEVGEAPMKVMMNGQLFILRGEKIYDATGRLVK